MSQPALFADRGFTGHEYLSWFKLYNMNGRLYDPLVGRFLNVDPVIQNPTSTQNYNRYSYCLNNPLKYTDPSGNQMQKSAYKYFMQNMLGNNGDRGCGDIGGGGTGGTGGIGGFSVFGRGFGGGENSVGGPSSANNSSSTTWITLGFFYYDKDGKPVTNNKGNRGEFWIFEATEYNESNPTGQGDWDLNGDVNTFVPILGWTGVAVDATKVLLTNTKIGSDLAYNIAYISPLAKGVSYLKPISYLLSGFALGGDIYLSKTIDPSTGKSYQTWGETGTNTIVSGAALSVGSWYGVLIQLDYMATKAYLTTSREHPEWLLTYPRSFYH